MAAVGKKGWVRVVVMYGVLSAIAFIMLLPLLWLVSTAFKSPTENIFQFPPRFLPEYVSLDNFLRSFGGFVDALKAGSGISYLSDLIQGIFGNFIRIWNSNPFGRYLFNSTVIAVVTVALNLLLCSLAAYPLARLNFKGRELLFSLIVATILIPFQIVMIPLYILTVRLGLTNTYMGVILPSIASAFGIFLMRQAFQGVPKELEEAARIDGCTELGIWWHIMLPSVRPALVTLAIFVFIGSWSDFLWPLLILDKVEAYTLPLGVARVAGQFPDWRDIAAGSVISIVPIILFFVMAQRYIVPSEAGSGVKG
ncbi:MAG: carbohydrate ABC transporter permease [Cyanobacteria bacterium J06581_3]